MTVLSRTNGVSGPLTTYISIASICEVSPSFVSVLNSLGLFLSYTTTERYRQKFIAERERNGPWDSTVVDTKVLHLLQLDNWDTTPLHAVKVDGKPTPKVNGSLLQGITKTGSLWIIWNAIGKVLKLKLVTGKLRASLAIGAHS